MITVTLTTSLLIMTRSTKTAIQTAAQWYNQQRLLFCGIQIPWKVTQGTKQDPKKKWQMLNSSHLVILKGSLVTMTNIFKYEQALGQVLNMNNALNIYTNSDNKGNSIETSSRR